MLAHLPHGGRGTGLKTDDWWAVHACASCHDLIDGRRPGEWTHTDLLRALHETLTRLVDDGLIEIKGA